MGIIIICYYGDDGRTRFRYDKPIGTDINKKSEIQKI